MPTNGRPPSKTLTKDMILRAMEKTQSNMAAARYLGCSYQHYRKFAGIYKGEDGRTLLEIHKNQAGVGIKKHIGGKYDDTPLMDILEGRVNVKNFTIKQLKNRLILDGYIEECCSRCGFEERRVVDFRVPLLLNFKNGNKEDWTLENIEFNCYNCHFLYLGDVFNKHQLRAMESYEVDPEDGDKYKVDWELDDSDIEHFKELGLMDEDEDPDGLDNIIDFK
jgi:hypothetical protein